MTLTLFDLHCDVIIDRLSLSLSLPFLLYLTHLSYFIYCKIILCFSRINFPFSQITINSNQSSLLPAISYISVLISERHLIKCWSDDLYKVVLKQMKSSHYFAILFICASNKPVVETIELTHVHFVFSSDKYKRTSEVGEKHNLQLCNSPSPNLTCLCLHACTHLS